MNTPYRSRGGPRGGSYHSCGGGCHNCNLTDYRKKQCPYPQSVCYDLVNNRCSRGPLKCRFNHRGITCNNCLRVEEHITKNCPEAIKGTEAGNGMLDHVEKFISKEYMALIEEKDVAVQQGDIIHELRKDFVQANDHVLTNHFAMNLPSKKYHTLHLFMVSVIDMKKMSS